MNPCRVCLCLMVVTVVSMVPERAAHASGSWFWNCQRAEVTSFWEEQIAGTELSGRGSICSTPYGVWSSLAVRGLTPGNAYTVWWVYVDQPQHCAATPLTPENSSVPFPEPVGYAGPCGIADFFTPDESGVFLNPLAVFGRMDSVVAHSSRRTFFRDDVRDFVPAPGSQLWLFVFGHGPADTTDKRQLARQLLTPEDPGSGAPHLGIEGRPFGYPAAVLVTEY
ncbi:MAG: hypothetical protein AAFX44_16285 [Pseudomonadota bacterium]